MAVDYITLKDADFEAGDPISSVSQSNFSDAGTYLVSGAAGSVYTSNTHYWADVEVKVGMSEDFKLFVGAVSSSPGDYSGYIVKFRKKMNGDWNAIFAYDGAATLADSYSWTTYEYHAGNFADDEPVQVKILWNAENIGVYVNDKLVGVPKIYTTDKTVAAINEPIRQSGVKYHGLKAMAAGVRVYSFNVGYVVPVGNPFDPITLYNDSFTFSGTWSPTTHASYINPDFVNGYASVSGATGNGTQLSLASNTTGGFKYLSISNFMKLQFSAGFGIYMRFYYVSGPLYVSFYTGVQQNISINGTCGGTYAQAGCHWAYYNKGTATAGTYTTTIPNGRWLHFWFHKDGLGSQNINSTTPVWNGTGYGKLWVSTSSAMPNPRTTPSTSAAMTLTAPLDFGFAGDNGTAVIDSLIIAAYPMGQYYTENTEWSAGPLPTSHVYNRPSIPTNLYTMVLPNATEVIS